MRKNDANREEVLKVIEQWANAIQTGNSKMLTGNHSKELVTFGLQLPLQLNGLRGYEKACHWFFTNGDALPASFDLVEINITASDSVAFCHALVIVSGNTPQYRLTVGLKKTGGKWQITHEHHSAAWNE